MKGAAKFILVMGMMIAAFSALLMPYQLKESSERVISWVNLGIGALMVISAGTYLVRAGRKTGTNRKG